MRLCGVGTRAAIGDRAMSGAVGWNRRRVHRLLARRGVLDDLGEGSTADPWREEVPVLAGIAGASVQGRRALGDRAGVARRRNCSRWRRRAADRVTLGETASISTPPSSCRRGIGPGSNGCAAMRSVLPSRPTGCT